MTVLLVVPARGGCKRIPDKNIAPLNGRSLIERTADQARGLGVTLLTTDSPAIAVEGARVGMLTPFLRPPELATDTATTAEAVLHALNWWRGSVDCLCVLQPTSPFRRPESIANAVRAVCDGAPAAVGVKRVPVDAQHLYGAGMKPLGGAGPAFHPNGAVYAIRPDVFRECMSFVPPGTVPLEMGDIESIDIDTPEQWRMAESVDRCWHEIC